MPVLDPVSALNDAVQSVKDAAAEFAPGRKDAALLAAGRVLLDSVPGLHYRVWPAEEPLLRTLDAQAKDFVDTARQVAMLRRHGNAEVLERLEQVLAELGYGRAEDGVIEVPF